LVYQRYSHGNRMLAIRDDFIGQQSSFQQLSARP
jgi:hypothetical protein